MTPKGRAWSNRNLARLAQKVSSPLIFAHVRAATGASLSEENCHPFNYGALLWMHNGHIANFPKLKRKLQNALNDEIYNFAQGQTDSEWAFALFLQKLSAHADLLAPSFPYDTLKQAMLEVIAQLNAWAREVGVDEPSLLNFAVTDGYSVVATRYISSSTDEAASLVSRYARPIASDSRTVL
jgi:glutamine amidotransferase